MEDESPPDQIALLRERCDKKEACDVDPKALFTKDKCPGKLFAGFDDCCTLIKCLMNTSADKPDSEFIAWIIYSCDGGGEDESNFNEAGMNKDISFLE